MKALKKIFNMTLVVFMCCGALVSMAGAEMVRKIVLFNAEVSLQERNQYASEWESYGVDSLMDLPFINGTVLNVPDTVTSAQLADDYRVATVEESDYKVKLQALTGAADGGAADGGAADGGAADGGATNFVKEVGKPTKGHRPWGVVKLNGAYYDPLEATSDFNEHRDEPKVIRDAVKRLEGHNAKVLRIAIFDSGVDTNHANLDGVVKKGVNFVNMTSGFPEDKNGHGTHVAGTLCSKYANGKFGLVPGAHLHPVKVLDENAIGDVASLIMGLQWAIDKKIDIINMSVAYAEDNPALRLAVEKAYEAGIVMVAAVGNHSNWDDPAPAGSADGGAADGGASDGGAADGGAADGGAADGGAAGSGSTENPYPVMYPAKYPEVIAVAATDAYGDVSAFSNTGPEVDILAPGTDVVSTDMGGGFGICSGTSMAVPHVTAAAAMMLALNSSLTPEDVQSILVETAMHGELDLVSALETVTAR